MSNPDNPLVFPIGDCNDHPGPMGMTLRDWFAGQALAGMLASKTYSNGGTGFERHIATVVYNIAEAMLAARSKP